MACKHAALAAIYAKQMAEMDEPWKLWEYRVSANCWGKFTAHFAFCEDWEYRQIPKTILINGIEVPEPMREKPELGTKVWAIYAAYEESVYCFEWLGRYEDHLALTRGQCHLTRENCIIHAKALFSFSEVK